MNITQTNQTPYIRFKTINAGETFVKPVLLPGGIRSQEDYPVYVKTAEMKDSYVNAINLLNGKPANFASDDPVIAIDSHFTWSLK